MFCVVLPPRFEKTPLLRFTRSPVIGGGHLALRFAGRIRSRVRHFHLPVRQADGFHRQIVSTAIAGWVIGGNNNILQLVLHVLDGLISGRATKCYLDFGDMLSVGRMQHDFGRVRTHLRLQHKFVMLTLRYCQAAPTAATRRDRLRHAVTEGYDLDLLLKAGDIAVTVDTLNLTKHVGWHVLAPVDVQLQFDKKGLRSLRQLLSVTQHEGRSPLTPLAFISLVLCPEPSAPRVADAMIKAVLSYMQSDHFQLGSRESLRPLGCALHWRRAAII
jgi:hypothetical protein